MPDRSPTHITLDDVASVRGARALSEAEMAGIYGGAPATHKEKQGTAVKRTDVKSDARPGIDTHIKLDPHLKLDKQNPAGTKASPPPVWGKVQ